MLTHFGMIASPTRKWTRREEKEQQQEELREVDGNNETEDIIFSVAVFDPTLAPRWNSKDATNLLVPKPSDANVCNTIRRRIDILESAWTDPNGYMQITAGGMNMATAVLIWTYSYVFNKGFETST